VGRVYLGASLTAAYLLIRGMLILRTGSARGVRAYMGEPQRAASKPAFRMVLFTAAIHIIPGVIVVALLAVVGVKHHLTLSEVAQHLGADGQLLLFTLLILGGAIYAIAYASRPATVGGAALAGGGGGIFTGGEPLSSEGRLTAGDFSSIFLQNWHEFFRWSNVDAVYLSVWRGLQAASRAVGVVVSWMERRALALVLVVSAAILAGVRWFATGESTWGLPPLEVPRLLIAACAMAGLALILAAMFSRASRRHIPQIYVPLMILISLATVAGMVVSNLWLRIGLLELGALLTVALVWLSARTFAAKLTYLAIVLISASSLIASDLLLE